MLTAFGDTEAAVECLRNGAADYLLKPPKVTELIRAIERALGRRRLELARRRYRKSLENRVKEKTAELSRTLRDLESTYSQTLWTLVAALDAREHETSDHSQRVVRYTLAIARRLGLPENDLPDIGRGALLHDIGKIGVPDAILLKPGRSRPRSGSRCASTRRSASTSSQRRLPPGPGGDGPLPPGALGRRRLPARPGRRRHPAVGARIFAIADCFDAMTSDRPYRKHTTADAARREILRCAGTQFDRRCADAFLSLTQEELDELARPTDERPI